MPQPAYLDHFRLLRAPFAPAPDASLFYAHGARHELLQALAYAVTHGDGIIKVTGEAGSGMTMLCHALAQQLMDQAIIIHMEPGSLGPLGVIHATAMALGLDPDGKRSDEVLRLLQAKLETMRIAGRHAVLMADHADMLPPEALEEIRLLTNLDTAQYKLLQIVLLGQPALNASLRQPAMRQFRERITLSFVMPALETDETPELLSHRLHASGYEGLELFASDAARTLACAAKGDLRRLMQLADKSLDAAASEGVVAVAKRHTQSAIKGRSSAMRRRSAIGPALAGTLAAVLGITALASVLWHGRDDGRGAQPGGKAPAAVQMTKAAAIKPAVSAAAVPAASAAASAAAATFTAPETAPVTKPVAASVSTAATSATAIAPRPSDLLQQTLKASKTWLRDEPAGNFSLQIESFPANDKVHAEDFLHDVRNAIGLREVHAYTVFYKGEHRISVVYGSFGSEKQARDMQTLLGDRWNYRPKIRAIKAIREAVAHAASKTGNASISATAKNTPAATPKRRLAS